jgi:hypothetical protein
MHADIFTFKLTAEVSAHADGTPYTVTVSPTGGMPLEAVKAVALEALAAWTGLYHHGYTLHPAPMPDDVYGVTVFAVTEG